MTVKVYQGTYGWFLDWFLNNDSENDLGDAELALLVLHKKGVTIQLSAVLSLSEGPNGEDWRIRAAISNEIASSISSGLYTLHPEIYFNSGSSPSTIVAKRVADPQLLNMIPVPGQGEPS